MSVVVAININYVKCKSCQECVVACHQGVLEWFEDKPIVAHPRYCKVCLDCEEACPVKAISISE